MPSSIGLILVTLSASSILLASKSVANPIQRNDLANPQKEKKFFGQSEQQPSSANVRGFFPAVRSWAQAPILMPYSDGNGFVSPFPSGLSDRWSGFMAEEQFGGAPMKRTVEGHFMEPSGWLGLGEPGRLEWNFNRLR